MFKPLLTPRDKAERYHRCLPEDIRQYLKHRGIPATIIDRQLLGWDGERITIPFFGRAGEVLGFRHAKPPEDLSDAPAMTSDPAVEHELYGWETLTREPYRVVICDGDFDRLVLEARGFPAVATGAACRFNAEWATYFEAVQEVYICFRRDGASDAAAQKVKSILPTARIARLPDTITDFFVDRRMTELDFEVVLAASEAGRGSEPPPEIRPLQPIHPSQRKRANRLRKAVRLHELVSQFTTLHAAGKRLVGHCPLHDDRDCSFTVFLEAETYRCAVCGAEGDVVMFLMDKESMTFGQALEALERFEFTHELYASD